MEYADALDTQVGTMEGHVKINLSSVGLSWIEQNEHSSFALGMDSCSCLFSCRSRYEWLREEPVFAISRESDAHARFKFTVEHCCDAGTSFRLSGRLFLFYFKSTELAQCDCTFFLQFNSLYRSPMFMFRYALVS